MEKKVFIIHGCSSEPEEMIPETRTYAKHWIPWLKRALIAKGIEVETPLMPKPWVPDFIEWKTEFDKYDINENTILIGHSCGAAFLVRWLGETKRSVLKLILVAPWKISNGNKKLFYDYPIDEEIKSRVSEIIMFTANNEEALGKESLEIFHKTLGGEVISLEGRGHYVFDSMKTEEFPELLEKVIK